MVVVDSHLFAWCLQRLPDLLPSTAQLNVKMSETQNLADQLANRFTADDQEQSALKKMLPGLKLHFGSRLYLTLGFYSQMFLLQRNSTGQKVLAESARSGWQQGNI